MPKIEVSLCSNNDMNATKNNKDSGVSTGHACEQQQQQPQQYNRQSGELSINYPFVSLLPPSFIVRRRRSWAFFKKEVVMHALPLSLLFLLAALSSIKSDG